MAAKTTVRYPRVIVVEGADGSGKSSLITGMVRELEARQFMVKYYREPGGSLEGEFLRSSLKQETAHKHEWSPRQQLLLMMASRDTLYNKVIPDDIEVAEAVNATPIFILDRNFLSSLIYQVKMQGASEELYKTLLDDIAVNFNVDLTIICTPAEWEDPKAELSRREGVVDNLDQIAIQNYAKIVTAYSELTEEDARSPILHVTNNVKDWQNIAVNFVENGHLDEVLTRLNLQPEQGNE